MAINIYIPNTDKILHKTEVDFTKRIIQRIINVVQQDKNIPIVEVQLYLDGKPYTIPPNINANLKLLRKDFVPINKPVLGCNATRTALYFDIDDQMSFYAGKLNPIIELNMGSGASLNRASSQSIPIIIDSVI